ncbi:MAG: DUF1566 domain-containing protein [Desulfobulbaceae bacterium]|nr:DUF1566 domain-containing protein [Desulfobulbaceae bacterium]
MKHFTLILALFLFTLMLQGCATTSQKMQETTFKLVSNEIFQLPDSELMWQKERSQAFDSREKAMEYVQNLNLGGYTDWRLPTPEEVLQLHNFVDFGKSSDGDAGIILKGNYWCAYKGGEVVAGSWQDGDSCEIDRSYLPHFNGYVRAVRP